MSEQEKQLTLAEEIVREDERRDAMWDEIDCLKRLRTTCQSAVSAFGIEYQLRKTQEECCELGAEIAHWLDGKISAEKLAKEAADVEITVTYIRLTIGDALVDEAKARKLERLRGIVRAKVESDQS